MSANIMLWAGPPGTWIFGVLADGTVFQCLDNTWKTVVGPQPENEAITLILEMTAMAESGGAKMMEGPREFAIAEDVLAAIQKDEDWERTGQILFEAFLA